ncbi:MAG: 4Fe-4S binding protein [Candidatus Moduliflexus flocculans]|nr:4Fe-4S binding protein [Candidatus Moduliflexus flocculans]
MVTEARRGDPEVSLRAASPAPENFRGAPIWDHHKCVGCAGCADHCPARTILVRDVCQEIRVMHLRRLAAAPTAAAAPMSARRRPSP